MKKEVLIISFLFVIIAFSSIVNASVTKGNISGIIDTSYSPSENIRGWINISVINELYDILVKGNSNFNGEIKLIDLLSLNNLEANTDYSCNPEDCEPYYQASGTGDTSKTFSLNPGQEKVLAFNIAGDKINSISGLTFDINIDNNLSCVNPLEIDLLADDGIEWKSTKFSQTAICPNTGKYGCFDKSASSDEADVNYPDDNIYCEKIKLSPSKYYNLGAYVTNTTAYYGNLRMSLNDLSGTEIARCPLTSLSSPGEYFCNVSVSSVDYEATDYYVCIQKTNSNGAYSIKTESSGEKCGFYGDIQSPPTTFLYDYYIFAEAYKFGSIGKITFNQTEYNAQGNDGSLGDYLATYLTKYTTDESIICTDGCAIPVKFKANTNMDITISNIVLNYATTQKSSSTNKIYEVETTKPKISFNYTILELNEANITAPSSYGNYTFILSVGSNQKIINASIKILKVPVIKGIYPTTVAAAYPTTFTLDVETQGNKSITNYTWYFGDGTTSETKTNFVEHAYNDTLGYALKVKVTDSEGLSSEKTFAISVGSPEEAVNATLTKYTKRIQNLTSQISTLPLSYQLFVKKVINTDNLTSQLQELQRQYNAAGGDKDKYIYIMNQLVAMNLPYKINITSKGDLPYYTNYLNINLDSLKAAGAGDYSTEDSDTYKKAIGGWEQDNLAMILHYEYVSAYYDNNINQLMGIFKLKITPNEEVKGTTENYLIFSDAIKGNNFDISDSSYDVKQLDSDVAIKFSNIDDREILFYYVGEKIYNNLNVYVSPEFSTLDIVTTVEPCNYNGICEEKETWRNCRADCKPWKIAWVLWVFLIFIAFIAYLIISQWYRVNYESKLFKNRQDIYNLMNFINTAIHQGLTYNTIRQKLKEMSWNNEQISYVINKYQGKSIVPLDISKLFAKKAKANTAEVPTQN